MNYMKIIIALILIIPVSATTSNYDGVNFQDKNAVINLLEKMFHCDQKASKELIQSSNQSLEEQQLKQDEVHALKKQHINCLKKIIEHYGWPKISDFGNQAFMHAWILVQHADYDCEFQEYCLQLMQSLPPDEVEAKWVAYLYDRVQINSKKPQRYGTQIKNETGTIHDLEDPESVNALRTSVGLKPLEHYLGDHKVFIKSLEKNLK